MSKRSKKKNRGRPAQEPVTVGRKLPPSITTPAPASPAVPKPPDVEVDGSFWRALLLALETRPTGLQTVTGSCGLEHKVLDVGIDAERKRVIVISDSDDPKVAAFLQTDLQQRYNDHKLIVARSVLVNVGEGLQGLRGLPALDMRKLKALGPKGAEEAMTAILDNLLSRITGDSRLKYNNNRGFLTQLVSQVVGLNWSNVKLPDKSAIDKVIELDPLIPEQPVDIHSQLGICPIPLYAMKADEVEAVKAATKADVAMELLKRHGAYEYFFPKADELALALVEHGAKNLDDVKRVAALAPASGHPITDLKNIDQLSDVVDALKQKGLVAEGELGFETTTEGNKVRGLVKFKPKESLFVKLKNLSGLTPLLKFLKDWWAP